MDLKIIIPSHFGVFKREFSFSLEIILRFKLELLYLEHLDIELKDVEISEHGQLAVEQGTLI